MNSHMKLKMSLKYYFTIKPTVNFLASIKQSDVLVDEGSDGLISLSSWQNIVRLVSDIVTMDVLEDLTCEDFSTCPVN